MAVNKNFVVKNGIEVATDLIFASSDLDKVGIGSTIPTATLEVGGDAKVTGNTELVGVTTVQDDLVVGTGGTVIIADVSAGRIGLNTSTPEYNVHISNVGSGLTTLYVDGGHLKVDGEIYADNILGITDIDAVNLNVTGIATFGDGSGDDSVDINADVDMDANLHLTGFSTFTQLIDADNGIDASTLKVEDLTDNRIVISGTGGELEDDSNLTFDGSEFNVGAAVSIYASSGIVSATKFYGDGSNLSNITATSGGSLGFSTSGSVGYGITLLNFVGAGVSTLSAPNSGIATLTIVGGGGGSASIGIGTTVGDAFSGIVTAGNLWYNTDEARLFIYYNDGSSSQWVDAAPFNIGIITSGLRSLSQGTALSPSLAFNGDTSTGLFSPASGEQTFVSSGASILNVNPSGIEVTGVSSVGSAITMYGNTGVVSATSFYGDGSNLSNTGASLSAGSGDLRVVLTNLTTGTMTSAATDAQLTYNSDTDTLTVSNVSIGGTLTYEDVTNVDSIGLITARSGIRIGTVSVGGTVGPVGSGIVTYYGDGSQLTGITSISNGTSNLNIVENSTISATVGGENIFNVTGAGVSMVAGERFDVSSYSENVAQLGSVSGTTNLGIGTHSVFIADISGTTSVSFQYEPNSMINGRLFSGTLILRFSGTGTRNVSLTSLNPKYIGGSGPTYSTTAVTDIISFFTPDNGATTYVTVVGQGFA